MKLWIKGLADTDVCCSFLTGVGSIWRRYADEPWHDTDGGSIWYLRDHECVVIVTDEIAVLLKANLLVEVYGETLD